MLHSTESAIIEDCGDYCSKRSTIAILRQIQQGGQSSRWLQDSRDQGNLERVLEKRDCGRPGNKETPENQASIQGDSALTVIVLPKEQNFILHQLLKILMCL